MLRSTNFSDMNLLTKVLSMVEDQRSGLFKDQSVQS